MPTPGAVVGTENGGMWKPGVHDVLCPETSLPLTLARWAFTP